MEPSQISDPLWVRFERRFLHPSLMEDGTVLMRARLMLYTAFGSALASIPVLSFAFAQRPEPFFNNAVLAAGHVLYSATFLLLRFFPSLTVPVTVMMVVAMLQLVNGSVLFGGMDSLVVYAFPIVPIFFGFVGTAIHGVISGVLLCSWVIALYFVDQGWLVEMSSFSPTREIQLVTVFWLISIGSGMAVAATTVFRKMTSQLLSEFEQRSLADQGAQDAQDAKDWFIAYFSHEMRTPLSVIAGSIDLMEHSTDPAIVARQRKAIRTASRGMVRLMDDLIDISALETGQLSLVVERMDIQQLLEEIGQEFSPVAQHKGLAIQHEYGSTPLWVRGDVQRVRQILYNLVENAIKYTATGGIALSMEEKVGVVRVCISDTGPGISADDQRYIFEPYVRAANVNVGGSGLGLTISRRLLQQMGTDLEMDSVLGEGSSFWFELSNAPG